MKIAVTGGAGFIGSHIVDRLLANGHQVAVIDNYSSGRAENLESAQQNHADHLLTHEVDIRDPGLFELFTKEKPECVLHLAAQIDVRKSVSNPMYDADVNITGTLNVLEASIRSGVRRLVFASSGGAVYSEPQYLPVDESHPKQPLSPYGISKKAIDDYLFFYATTYGLPSLSLALGNVYGPRQDPYGEAGVVAIFIGQMLTGKIPTINGDGNQLRDYVYVQDIVDAFVAAMDVEKTGFFNIGTGIGTSVNDLYHELAKAVGFTLPPTYGPAKPGEMRRIYLDYKAAERHIGWKPRYALTDGLLATVEFFRTVGFTK